MAQNPEDLVAWDFDMLDQLQSKYRADNNLAGVALVDRTLALKGADGVQTSELSNSGKLFRHRQVDPETNRLTFTHTGDISAFMSPFQTGATVARIDTTLFTGANSP